MANTVEDFPAEELQLVVLPLVCEPCPSQVEEFTAAAARSVFKTARTCWLHSSRSFLRFCWQVNTHKSAMPCGRNT